jgi:hypothetical protein
MRHARAEERRLDEDRLHLFPQRFLGGAVEKAWEIIDPGAMATAASGMILQPFSRLSSPPGASYRRRRFHPSASRAIQASFEAMYGRS